MIIFGIESINFNPQGTTSLDTNREIRVIQDALDNATQSLLFELKSRFFVRNDEIQDIISKEKPRVVHFAGHGANSKGLILENKTGDIHFLNTEAFKDVLKFFDHQIECVVLNACYSEEPAQVIHQHINYVIGTRRKIQDKAAIAFTNQIGLLYYQKNISPYLPPAQDKFKVLMTSRQRPGKNLQALDLDVLSEEAALELLSELAGEERIESELEKIAITKFIPQTPTQEDISRVALGIPHLSHVATELIEYAIMKLLQMPEEELRQILPPEAFEQLLQFKQQIQSET